MQRGKMLIIGAALLGLLSLLFPYFAADTLGEVSARTAGGLFPAGAIAAAGVVAAVGDRREGLNGLGAVAATATVALALILTGAIAIDAVLAGREAEEFGVDSSIRNGLWLLAGSCALSVFGVIAAMSRRLS